MKTIAIFSGDEERRMVDVQGFIFDGSDLNDLIEITGWWKNTQEFVFLFVKVGH